MKKRKFTILIEGTIGESRLPIPQLFGAGLLKGQADFSERSEALRQYVKDIEDAAPGGVNLTRRVVSMSGHVVDRLRHKPARAEGGSDG